MRAVSILLFGVLGLFLGEFFGAMMQPNDKRRLPIRGRIQKLERAAVATRDPQLLVLQRLDEGVQGRVLLSVSILDGHDVGHRTASRIEHHQRLARQRSRRLRTRLRQTMLGGGEMIAAEDPMIVTRDFVLRTPTTLAPHFDDLLIRMPHQFPHGLRFDSLSVLRHSGLEDQEFVTHLLERGVDAGRLPEHDEGHQMSARQEQQSPLGLRLGVPMKQVVERPWIEQPLQHQLSIDRNRSLLSKAVINGILEQRSRHVCLPWLVETRENKPYSS